MRWNWGTIISLSAIMIAGGAVAFFLCAPDDPADCRPQEFHTRHRYTDAEMEKLMSGQSLPVNRNETPLKKTN